MFKIILFLALLTFKNSSAQDRVASQNPQARQNPQANQNSQAKKIIRSPLYQSFDNKFNNLTPLQLKKYSEINLKHVEELTKSHNEYRKKIKEITKSPTVIMNFETVFSAQEVKGGGREVPAGIKLQNEKILNEYKKLPPDQRKKVRLEIINYRKAINKTEKERRVALKNLFKQDFEMFYESEDIAKINNDERTIDQEFHKK